MKARSARRFLLAAVAAAVWIQSDRPAVFREPVFPCQDKVFHIIEFAAVGIALAANRDMFGTRHPWAFMAVAGLVWAGLDEIHQSWVPGRDCSALDFAADSLGLGMALMIARRRAMRSALAPPREGGYNGDP